MTTVAKSRLISHPPAAVWKALADFGAISRWAPGVEHSSVASATTDGVGAVRRVQLGRIALLERVTDWLPDERLRYAITGLPPAAGAVETTWTLLPQDGGTLTTMSTTIDAVPGPPGKVVSRVLRRKLGSESSRMLAGLADYLEELS
ncbi:MAG: SRPBCC family protein [Frankiaceae bacterium]|nr:SRPBCC family protein [Frankiaceae bacterium]MBV9869657.1 SRPBCC family protein [Frankiaceae bacterium]